nr:MAG: E2 protein [Varecia variegata papillomavirus 2]WPK29463.1 MAG: E2 protein [Varecia variegata papillomavirus 2]
METLSQRFDALQEQLLSHYEAGSKHLADQIQYWLLLRKESVLLHFARKKGLQKLGLQQVPTLAVSEHNAKRAIMMGMLLQSLSESQYGRETWTMPDTSLEMLDCPPRGCFKKGAHVVDVMFDNDPQNIFPYTAWNRIFFQDSDGAWQLSSGEADYEGLFYRDSEGCKMYYVKFGKDALRFGNSGMWKIQYKNRTISAPVTSTTPPFRPARTSTPRRRRAIAAAVPGPPATAPDTEPGPGPDPDPDPDPEPRHAARHPGCRRPLQLAFPTHTESTTAERPRQRQGHESGGLQYGGQQQGQQQQRQQQHRKGDRQRQCTEDRVPEEEAEEQRPHKRQKGDIDGGLPEGHGRRAGPAGRGSKTGGRGGRGGGRGRGRGSGGRGGGGQQGRRPGEEPESAPQWLGRGAGTPEGQGQQGSGPVSSTTGNTPVVLLKGESNRLKCWRYRCRHKWSNLYYRVSSGFSWLGEDACKGDARMLFAFAGLGQRQNFLDTVTFPPGSEVTLGAIATFGGLLDL